jgi:hypothetical protein
LLPQRAAIMHAVYLLLKALKLLAVLGYGSGALCASFSSEHADIERFVYRLAAPSFALIWALGIGLTHVSEASILSTWVLGSAGLSIVSLNGLLYLAGKPGRQSWVARCVALLPIAGAVVLMTTKPV